LKLVRFTNAGADGAAPLPGVVIAERVHALADLLVDPPSDEIDLIANWPAHSVRIEAALQSSPTAGQPVAEVRHLVFNIFEQIEHLSAAMTLEPGDLIFTGTPGGAGAAMDPRKFLQPGDRVRVAISGIGSIEAAMRAAA
jgi:hypothetical protein